MSSGEVRKVCPTCAHGWLDKYNKPECPKCCNPLGRDNGLPPKPKAAPRASDPGELNDPIAQVFLQYANIGGKQGTLSTASLEGMKWNKVCRESGLSGGSLTPMEVDNIFMRVTRGGKRMGWAQFCDALDHVAATKKISREQVEFKLGGADPTAGVTKPEFVRHHDDKSTYTGVYKAGGPSNLSGKA